MSTTVDGQERELHGDTITVKGEKVWSRQSSPDSMSPEIDINSLLTQINNAPPNLESPEPLQYEHTTSNHTAPPHSNPSAARNYLQKPRHSLNATQEDRLTVLPAKRALPWRDGVDTTAQDETGGESRRKQIRFGCLLATRGEVQDQPCSSCANGRGKFRLCIALDGFFKGACASCQLSGRPNRCSIKKEDDVTSSPFASIPNGEPVSRPRPPVQKNGPQAKRQKTDAVPDWESARPQWHQELGNSQARQQAGEQGQPWINPQSSARNMFQEMHGTQSTPSSMESRMPVHHWAPVNSNVAVVGPQTFPAPDMGTASRVDLERTRRDSTLGMDDGSVPLIDTLPKSKQRQVYGLVSGIQSGIDHLQRELDSLKRVIGIDDEDGQS